MIRMFASPPPIAQTFHAACPECGEVAEWTATRRDTMRTVRRDGSPVENVHGQTVGYRIDCRCRLAGTGAPHGGAE